MSTGPVMLCPNCNGPKNRLLKLTQHRRFNYLRRRRKCLECEHIWTTLEIIENEIKIERLE